MNEEDTFFRDFDYSDIDSDETLTATETEKYIYGDE